MGTSISIAEALFSKTQRRVLGLLYGRPERSFYLKEIFDLINVGRGTVQRELEKLVGAGLITLSPSGGQRHYQANRDCPIFLEMRGIVAKTVGLVDVLAVALRPLTDKIRIAFVYGSMASGKALSGSDVDLMVVGEITFLEVVKALHDAQEQLGREINPKVFSKEEWKKMTKKREAFLREVIAKPKLFVVGDASELG